jgi:ribosomal protein S18 acetylase RimI-like enzyme
MNIRKGLPHELSVALELDNDAGGLFTDFGLAFDHLTPTHPFVVHEAERWAAALRDARLFFACTPDGVPIGFVALGTVDGQAHLDQLAVRRAFMRCGVGRALMAHARSVSQSRSALWLTTYDHVPWNRPYYETLGFRVVPEAECGDEVRAILRAERGALPDPEKRVAMRLALA